MGFRKRKQQPQAFHEESERQRTEKDQAKAAEINPAKPPAKAAKKKTGSKRARKR